MTVSVGGFVPKPFTPFQWFGQNTARRAAAARSTCCATRPGAAKGVQLKWHDPKATLVEGLRQPGRPPPRRRSSRTVWRRGGTFQEWTEHFRLDLWLEAMADHGLDIDWYVYRHRTEDEVLPWDHISAGLHKDFLWQDWQDALAEVGLPDCRWTPCYDCGACTGYGIEHVVASATAPGRRQPGHRPGPVAGDGAVPVTLRTRRWPRRRHDGGRQRHAA